MADPRPVLFPREQRAHWLAIAAVALLFLVVLLWPRATPTPLPPVVQQALERHHVQSAADSVQQRALLARARADSVHAAAAKIAASRAARAATEARQRADSLAQVAQSIRDSGDAWHAAYDARTVERDSLAVALVGEVERGEALEAELAHVDSAFALERTRRQRADSLVASLVLLAEQRENRCRVLHVFACPSRTAIAIGAGALGYVIGRGLLAKINIKLPP